MRNKVSESCSMWYMCVQRSKRIRRKPVKDMRKKLRIERLIRSLLRSLRTEVNSDFSKNQIKKEYLSTSISTFLAEKYWFFSKVNDRNFHYILISFFILR